MTLDSVTIHSLLADRWPEVLEELGIEGEFLRNRHGPCPACGGKDRFRFDNHRRRGNFYCNHCGAGDGFRLLQLVQGWEFPEARRRVVEVAGLSDGAQRLSNVVVSRCPESREEAVPTPRVRNVLRQATTPDLVPDVADYLRRRLLWPLPAGCTLRAHANLEYWDNKSVIGRYPALLAEIRDVGNALVTAHATWLERCEKLTAHTPRKLLGRLTGRCGCACPLMPVPGDTLGIAEGIETALAASRIHRVPVWATLNTSLLSKFEPPPGVHRLIVFADNDIAGLRAALNLTESLNGRVTVLSEVPPRDGEDWADVLMRMSLK